MASTLRQRRNSPRISQVEQIRIMEANRNFYRNACEQEQFPIGKWVLVVGAETYNAQITVADSYQELTALICGPCYLTQVSRSELPISVC
jgi:hypothetical protein